MRYFKHITR